MQRVDFCAAQLLFFVRVVQVFCGLNVVDKKCTLLVYRIHKSFCTLWFCFVLLAMLKPELDAFSQRHQIHVGGSAAGEV